MAGYIPQFGVVDIGRDNFLKSSFPVFLLDHIDESIVNNRAVRQEESAAGAQRVEEEKILILGELENKTGCMMAAAYVCASMGNTFLGKRVVS